MNTDGHVGSGWHTSASRPEAWGSHSTVPGRTFQEARPVLGVRRLTSAELNLSCLEANPSDGNWTHS